MTASVKSLSLRERQLILRNHFPTFVHRAFRQLNPNTPYVPNWHLEVIAAKMEACRRGEIRRLIINVPPRSLKSIMGSIALPAFWLGHHPSAEIIAVSYAQSLADKFSNDSRAILLSDWYQAAFATRLSPLKQTQQEFKTTQGGGRFATSVGGVLTGRGADLIIIDDALKAEDALSDAQRLAANAWYDGTLLSRINDKATGCIIVIQQRLHLDDLVGHILQQEGWDVLSFPAIAEADEEHVIQTVLGERRYRRRAGEALHPERESLAILKSLRESVGLFNFAAQYLQSPVPVGGALVKAEWFRTYEPGDLPEQPDFVIQSWDTANKAAALNHYSVCTTWAVVGSKYFLLHVLRQRLIYPELKRAVQAQALVYRPKLILIEDKASGTQLIQELINAGVPGVQAYTSAIDKKMRLNAQTAAIEQGMVYLPRSASWKDDYVQEMISFPFGSYDDQVDSTSQALEWIQTAQMEPSLLVFFRNESRRLNPNYREPVLLIQGR